MNANNNITSLPTPSPYENSLTKEEQTKFLDDTITELVCSVTENL